MFQLVPCSFSTIPICPFLIQRIFPYTCTIAVHCFDCKIVCVVAQLMTFAYLILNVKSANIITAKRVLTELTRPEGRDCTRRSPSVRSRIKGEVPGIKMSAVKFKRIAKAEAKCLRL